MVPAFSNCFGRTPLTLKVLKHFLKVFRARRQTLQKLLKLEAVIRRVEQFVQILHIAPILSPGEAAALARIRGLDQSPIAGGH